MPGRKFRKVMAAVAVMAFAHVSHGDVNQPTSPREHHVRIEKFRFVPATLEVRPGDTITWTNRDIAPHTATSNDGGWDTELIAQNQSKSIVVTKSFASNYVCAYHPKMKGNIKLSRLDE